MSKEKIIFGLNPVLETLRSNPQKIRKILVAKGRSGVDLEEIISLTKLYNIPLQKLSRHILNKYINQNHQGIVALVSSSDYVDEEELLSILTQKPQSLSLILDGIEDPRNFGSILRTAECAGVEAVFIPERRAVGLTEIVAKTSAGATEYIKVARVKNINNLIEKLKQIGIWIVGADAKADKTYIEWDWTGKCALVLGSEGKGLHYLTKQKCDILVKIPILGRIENLNVSVAAGIILYEALRQRKMILKEEASHPS